MLDHLRRLSPPRRADATRAVGAVASRFARPAPLRSGPIAAPWIAPADEDAQHGAPAATFDPQGAASSDDGSDELPATQSGTATCTTGAGTTQPIASRALRSGAHAGVDLGALDLTVRSGGVLRGALEQGTASDNATAPDRPRNRGKATGAPAALLNAAAGAPTVARAAPFSHARRSERDRGTTSAGATPEIHVTIDRIEVRSPNAGERVPAASKGRQDAPGTSLRDYLRGGGRSQPR